MNKLYTVKLNDDTEFWNEMLKLHVMLEGERNTFIHKMEVKSL